MIEPEEIIEATIVSLLSAAFPSGAQILGALMPGEEDEAKISSSCCISVIVDQASQDLDWEGPGCPCTYSVRVLLRVPFSDEKTGAGFRNAARDVRAALSPLLGDGCAALTGGGFCCDSFTLDSTATEFDSTQGDQAMSKTYNATVKGRFVPTTEIQEG